MNDAFLEGALLTLIVFLAILAVISKPPIERVCTVVGNPGSYVCDER